MSSQDTMQRAESEEESARIVQSEIEKQQSKVTAMQRDIDQESRIIQDLQSKQQQHLQEGQKLRQQAAQEQQQEAQERQRQLEQQNSDSAAGQAAKETIKHSLF